MRPVLVGVAHGTRDPAGHEVISALLDAVRRRLPDVDVITAWVELVEPGLDEVMTAMGRPAVVVPLLLSTGYHVTTDVPAAASLSGAPVQIAAPLGPDRHLARAMAGRLREAGARWGDAVVLAAAGSTDPAALTDVEQAAILLRSEWGPCVTHACVSAAGPDLPTAVDDLRRSGAERVCVAPYLLAPGRFSRQVTDQAVAAGATMVAPVLGGHGLVADLVARRYRQAHMRGTAGVGGEGMQALGRSGTGDRPVGQRRARIRHDTAAAGLDVDLVLVSPT